MKNIIICIVASLLITSCESQMGGGGASTDDCGCLEYKGNEENIGETSFLGIKSKYCKHCEDCYNDVCTCRSKSYCDQVGMITGIVIGSLCCLCGMCCCYSCRENIKEGCQECMKGMCMCCCGCLYQNKSKSSDRVSYHYGSKTMKKSDQTDKPDQHETNETEMTTNNGESTPKEPVTEDLENQTVAIIYGNDKTE